MVEFIDKNTGQMIHIFIEKQLLEIWDKIREGKIVEKNQDRVYLVDGRERRGKSSFAIQMGKYLDTSLNVDRICVEPDDFLHQIRNCPKGSVVIFDEAFRGLSSKSTRSKVNRAIVEALMEVGQRNLIIFIVLPTIFLLEIYAAVFRSEALFHIFQTKDKRRAFKIYNYEKKKILYLRGKTKYFSYSVPRIKRAKGRFLVKKSKKYPTGIPYETFEQEKYEKKKYEAFRKEIIPEERESKGTQQRNLMILGRYKALKSYAKVTRELNDSGMEISSTQVREIVKKLTEKEQNKTEEYGNES
jgi:hypothetical protein